MINSRTEDMQWNVVAWATWASLAHTYNREFHGVKIDSNRNDFNDDGGDDNAGAAG